MKKETTLCDLCGAEEDCALISLPYDTRWDGVETNTLTFDKDVCVKCAAKILNRMPVALIGKGNNMFAIGRAMLNYVQDTLQWKH